MTSLLEDTVTTTTATFAVDPAALLPALTWVTAAASKDEYFPALTAVHITIGDGDTATPHFNHDWAPVTMSGPTMTVACTDRYRLHWATVPLLGEAEEQTLQVKAADLLATVKKLKPGSPSSYGAKAILSFTLADNSVQLSCPQLAEAVEDVPTVSDQFPRYSHLIPWGQEGPQVTTQPFALAGDLIYQLGRAAKAANKKDATVRFLAITHDTYVKRPILIAVGANEKTYYQSGLIMPVAMPRTWR